MPANQFKSKEKPNAILHVQKNEVWVNECVRVLVEIRSVNRQRKAFKNQADESKEEKERERERESQNK